MDTFVDLLREAAGKIGVESARLWPQVVGITFVQSLFLAGLDLACAAGFAVLMVRCWRARPADDDDEAWRRWGPLPVVGAACCGMLSLLCVWAISMQLPGVFYPEAKTVLDLIKAVK